MSAMLKLTATTRQEHYQALMDGANGTPNCVWLAQIISTWLTGGGVLPKTLGLDGPEFGQLMQLCFPGYRLRCPLPQKKLDFSRMLEKQDLEQLLQRYAAEDTVEAPWLVSIIVAASLGSDHLWQDLGLWGRQELSALLHHNFPALAARNSRDMKWKKFIYKQLCEEEGLYVCRAPSCEVCKDYPVCFGPEE